MIVKQDGIKGNMMPNPTLMGSRTTRGTTNGGAQRKLASWIGSFVDYTENLDAPEIWRRWAAISAIGAALEQKVYILTSAPIWPNFYNFLVGHPGTGKTRAVMEARKFLAELPEFNIAPTSMKMGSLVDRLKEAKRVIINMPYPPLEFNSMALIVDEWGAFMHQYDDELMAGLTTFYDVNIPYEQWRRGQGGLKLQIKAPQLSILAGTTPANLLKFMPEIAWDQGFTSRIILIFSDHKPDPDFDEFSITFREPPADMFHDFKCIYTLVGQFSVTPEYRKASLIWRQLGYTPVPNHPKLVHYATRRRVHLHKLAMIASVDRGDSLTLTREDFNKAMGWLLEAESFMPSIFQAGIAGADGRAMEEIRHLIEIADIKGTGVSEHKVVKFASERVPAHTVMRMLENMERSGMIEVDHKDKLGIRYYKIINQPLHGQ